MKIKNLYDTKLKKAILTGTALGIIAGTYGGNEEGFTPFYNVKSGKSGGINISGHTRFMPGSEFYGVNLSLMNNNVGGTINGLNLGCFNIYTSKNEKKINGLEIGILNMMYENDDTTLTINGLQIGFENVAGEGNCAQIGLANEVKKGNSVQAGLANVISGEGQNNIQAGIYNQIKKPNGKIKRSLLLNYHFRGKGK